MNDNGIVIRILLIMLCVMIFGGQLGITVSGEIVQPSVGEDAPGLLGIISWCWDGMVFFFSMIAFSVPGMPVWISAGFLIATLLILFIVLKWVRGTGGT